MTFVEFLQHEDLRSLVLHYKVIMFMGEGDYPLLFFMQFFKLLRTSCDIPLEMVDGSEHELHILKGKFETSFLGLTYIYWLKSFHSFDDKKKKQWLSYLTNYSGPNILMFYGSTHHDVLDHERSLCIELPAQVDASLMNKLMRILHSKPSQAGLGMISRVFKKYTSLSLDQAVYVMHYASLISGTDREGIDDIIDVLVGTEQSLFTLSTYFFAKQREAFFGIWASLHNRYPEVFWITFWCEQVWRASFYVMYASNRNMVEAKKIAYRLPFSFMQKDWKLHNKAELMAAHQFLYSADYAFKNGNESPLIELFYIKFFEGGFKN